MVLASGYENLDNKITKHGKDEIKPETKPKRNVQDQERHLNSVFAKQGNHTKGFTYSGDNF